MLTLDELFAEIKNTEDFNASTEIFLNSRKQIIDELIEKKDKEALTQLLKDDVQNLALLKERLTASKEHISNLNKIENYIT